MEELRVTALCPQKGMHLEVPVGWKGSHVPFLSCKVDVSAPFFHQPCLSLTWEGHLQLWPLSSLLPAPFPHHSLHSILLYISARTSQTHIHWDPITEWLTGHPSQSYLHFKTTTVTLLKRVLSQAWAALNFGDTLGHLQVLPCFLVVSLLTAPLAKILFILLLCFMSLNL